MPTRQPRLVPSNARPMSLTRVLGERLAIAWALSLVGVVVFDTTRYLIDMWRFDLPVYAPSLIDAELFGIHTFVGWAIVGFGGTLAITYILSGARATHRWVRVLAWLAVAGSAVMLIGSVYEWSWRHRHNVDYDLGYTIQNALLYAGGIFASLWIALGKLAPMPDRSRLRGLTIGAAALGALVLGGPTMAETWREYQPQELPNFTVELVAAQRVAPSASAGEIVETEYGRFLLDRSDTLRFTRGHVRRVRRVGNGVSIRTSGRIAHAIRQRAKRRLGLNDAIFVNGKLMSAPIYEGYLVDGRLFVTSKADGSQRLYDALTAPRGWCGGSH